MSIIGTRVQRVEDPVLLTTGGTYVDDIACPGALFATFVRSVMPHATITGIDTTSAVGSPGVVGVFTATDLGFELRSPAMAPFNREMKRRWLASDTVRYVGEPVAVVVSDTRDAGADAAELVEIGYEALPVVIGPFTSIRDKQLLFPEAGTNVAFSIPKTEKSVPFGQCDLTVSLTFVNQRLAPCALEPRAALAVWEDGRLTQWSSTQNAHGTRDRLADALGLDKSAVRVIAPDVGGGFGAKNGAYTEDMVVAHLARHLGRPVRWASTRSEDMLGIAHGRGQIFEATMGGSHDGRIQCYQLRVAQDSGAYPEIGTMLPFMTHLMTSGVYDIEHVSYQADSVVTNTLPVGAYRGAGRPEAAAAIERMVDVFAAECGIDPAEVRRRNFLPPEAFPLATPTGAKMDTGEYARALDLALTAAGYDELRVEQARRRATGDTKLLGIGLATYVEITNPTQTGEWGSIEIRPDGSALLLTGQSPHGQGHYTTFSQLASELTGIPIDRIEVRHGDTDLIPRGAGTGGSKAVQLGGTAIWQATERVVEDARHLAAQLLEANPDDIVLDTATSQFSVAGTPAIHRSWADLAAQAVASGTTLSAEIDFQPAGATFPFGAHVSVIEVDVETGEVTVVRHIACDDAGTLVNPLLVDGQVHGGLAQGIAQALLEEVRYDLAGNPLTTNFMDYAIISAAELPSFERIELQTPTPLNPLGAKGVGESGTIGSTPAVQNAVVDALSHLGVRHIDLPVKPERVWEALRRSR
ncbi:MAG: xanthine dehydrogenase family protein molybdopterin-binding subunit [Actinomycetota bacterium]|nr:xanthine dehydrogenase family protein molybdopterin-binding subunit [Actinomycetota bacterium]